MMIKMPSRKKKWLILLVGIGILSTIYIYGSIDQNKVPTPPSITNNTQPTPNSRPPLQVTLPPINDINGLIPQRVDIYTITHTPLTQTQITQIAQSLQFTTPPETYNDSVLGPTYSWNNQNRSLVINANYRSINYYNATPTKTTKINQNIFGKNAQKFIDSINTVSPYKFTVKSIDYFIGEDEARRLVSENIATSAVVNIQALLNNTPIIGLSTYNVHPSLAINSNNEIASAHLILPYETYTLDTSVPVYSREELNSLVPSAQPLFLTSPTALDPYDDPPVGKLNLENVTLGYYQKPGGNKVVPIFLLNTTGNSQIEKSKVTTIFYIPAGKY